MTLVLDSGGLSSLANNRARLAALRRRGHWPPKVPAVVLAETLTGDHRRDHATNRLIAMARVVPVSEAHGREAARLRTAAHRAGTIAATDAIVAAVAAECSEPAILTSDPGDLRDLTASLAVPVRIIAV